MLDYAGVLRRRQAQPPPRLLRTTATAATATTTTTTRMVITGRLIGSLSLNLACIMTRRTIPGTIAALCSTSSEQQGRHCTDASSGPGVERNPVPPAEKDLEEDVEVLP